MQTLRQTESVMQSVSHSQAIRQRAEIEQVDRESPMANTEADTNAVNSQAVRERAKIEQIDRAGSMTNTEEDRNAVSLSGNKTEDSDR